MEKLRKKRQRRKLPEPGLVSRLEVKHLNIVMFIQSQPEPPGVPRDSNIWLCWRKSPGLKRRAH